MKVKGSNGSDIIGEGVGEGKVELQRKQADLEAFPANTDTYSSMDRQQRTTFYALKDARSS